MFERWSFHKKAKKKTAWNDKMKPVIVCYHHVCLLLLGSFNAARWVCKNIKGVDVVNILNRKQGKTNPAYA